MDEMHKNPDEEEDMDLDALRLAALQSLKKKSQQQQQTNNETISPFSNVKDNLGHFSARGKAKRGKFVRPQQGRIPRNGQFNNGWARNSNLISVPMVSDDSGEKSTSSDSPTKQDVPKLILPQDRYCKNKQVTAGEKTDNTASKFDRYNNSDESDSDSDEDRFRSDEDEKSEIKRSNSLENLMAELENEIQGGVEVKKEVKPKPKKKRKLSEDDNESGEIAKQENVVAVKENLKPEQHEVVVKPVVVVEKPINTFNNKRKWTNPPRKYPAPGPVVQNNYAAAPPPNRVMMNNPPVQDVIPVPQYFQQNYNVYSSPNSVYVPPPPMMFEVPPPQIGPPPPPVYDNRALSPIGIKTDFSTNTLGPLSPRSAAFVLQNRAIIEKRKRRSYSRSPSPRFAPKSPKRFSLSPKRPSKSPPSKRRSLSPSPVRKVLPPRSQPAKKQSSIHDRLGIKTKPDETVKRDKQKDEEKVSETSGVVDPVLEARRRKFERSEISLKGGVIRLKTTKDEEETQEQIIVEKQQQEEDAVVAEEEDVKSRNEEKEAEELEDTIELLDHNNDLLFSDEESDSDNEGRFKTKQENNEKIQILPFRKLVNGVKSTSSSSSTNKRAEKRTLNEEKVSKVERKKRHRTNRSPSRKLASKKLTSGETKVVKQSGGGIFQNNTDKKIEIKIRNPSKYEREKKSSSSSSSKVVNKLSDEKNGRKVVEIHRIGDENDGGGGDVVEAVEEAQISNEGDLRAQLSRKRAERQKHPAPEVVLPTRLLRNALQQSVGFRKTTKIVKDETVEGKLPIHLRLGSTNSGTLSSSSESGFGKKSRKHIATTNSSSSKSKGTSLEQV